MMNLQGVRARFARDQGLPFTDSLSEPSILDALEPLLRIYEGCGRAYLGEVEGANIIKIHRRSGKVSYLVYPDFENDPHPALLRSVRGMLQV